jgi:hypothetical protein
MGKRELVLIALFVVLGAGVYQLTAPPAPPGSELSVGGLFQRMRRGVQGARETASADSHQAVAVAPGISLIRVALPRPSDVTLTGTDGDQITVETRVSARGFDQAEAKAAAGSVQVTVAPGDATTMVLTGNWSDRRGGPAGFVTQVALTIAIPRRLHVTMQPHIGLLTVSDVAAFECMSSRGETHVTGTTGSVQLGHAGGAIEVKGGTSLKLTTRNGRGEVHGIQGATHVDATGSRLVISEISGTLEIETRNSDITLEKIAALQAPFRYNGNGGSLRVDGLRVESRIDGRSTDVDVRLAAAAPVTIYNLGAIVVTAPPGGYTLDAQASEGRITSDDPGIALTEGPDSKATGKVRGGGPALTLRATRGRIDVRHASAVTEGAGK